jgi:hypothetical protein
MNQNDQDPESAGIEYAQRYGIRRPDEMAEYATTFGEVVRENEQRYDAYPTIDETFAKPKW